MPIQLLCCTLKWDHLLRKDLRDFSPKVMAKKYRITCSKKKKTRKEYSLVMSTIARKPSEIIPLHTKNQENPNMNEKRQSTESNIRTNQMLGLSDKDFYATIIKVFQQTIKNSLETNLSKI